MHIYSYICIYNIHIQKDKNCAGIELGRFFCDFFR